MEIPVVGLFTVLAGMAMDRGNVWTAGACLAVALVLLAVLVFKNLGKKHPS